MSLEITAGTAVIILLAGVLDDYGLGFGYGALLFYALEFIAAETHRILEYFAAAPSIDAMYKPFGLWAVFTLAVTIGAVAVLLAFRRYPASSERETRGGSIDLRLVTSGVLRPGMFVFAFIGLPAAIYHFYNDPLPLSWFVDNWSPYGTVAWLAVAYVVLEIGLLVSFAVGLAWADFWIAGGPFHIARRLMMLAAIGGAFMAALSGVLLALLIAVARVADHLATEAAGQLISVSGYNILVVVAMVLMAILWIEGRGRVAPLTMTPALLP